MMLSASWGAVMSRAGEIDRFREDGFPIHLSPPPSRGSPAVAARRQRRQGGAIPTTFLAPEEARGVTAVANAVAFFAMMDAFVRWRGGCCVDNGGSDVLTLTACKSRQWTARREREGGGGGRSDEAVVMLPRGGQATDDTTREGGGGGSGTRRAGDLLRPADSNECRFGYHCRRRASEYCITERQ